MNPAVRRYVKDLLERVLWTFLEAFFGAVVLAYAAAGLDLDSAVTDWSAWEKILTAGTTAGLAAVGALIKGLIASRLGDTGTASTVRLDDLDDPAGAAGSADGPTGLGVLVSIQDGAGPVSMHAGAPVAEPPGSP